MAPSDIGATGPRPIRPALPTPTSPKLPPLAPPQAPQAGCAVPAGTELPNVPDAGPASAFGLEADPRAEDDQAFLKRLYKEELGRDADPAGLAAWAKNLAQGMSRDEARRHFQNAPEARLPETIARKAWQKSMAGAEGQDPVETIKPDPRYARAQLDTTSLQTATESAAQWVHETYPELVKALDEAHHAVPENKQKSRQLAYELTGHLIGALRANGVDAQRLVRQSHNDFGNPSRYVNDAFVLPDGRAIDWLGGEGVDRQFHDLDVPSPKTDRNFGVVPREEGAPLSSSTLGL